MTGVWLTLLCVAVAIAGCGDDAAGPDCVEFVTVSSSADYYAVEEQRARLPCPASDSAEVFGIVEGLTHLFCYDDREATVDHAERYPEDLPDVECDPSFSSGRSCRSPLGNPFAHSCWCPPDRVGRPGGASFCESELGI